MLGSTPALDVPTRIYQRLIANDADEAVEIASTEIEKSSIISFYDAIGIEVLLSGKRGVSPQRKRRAPPASGKWNGYTARRSEGPIPLLPEFGCKGNGPVHRRKIPEIDALAGEMLAHALAFEGIAAVSQPAASVNANYLAKLDLKGADIVCLQLLCAESSDPRSPRRPASAKTMAECAYRSGAMECAGGTVDR